MSLALALAGLAPGTTDDLWAQDASVMPAAHGEALPPAVIEGLDMRPSVPLEFSRAWLAKSSDVRRRRAELRADGTLEGLAPPDLARLGAALSGQLRIPVIAVRYSDVDAPFPVLSLANRLFGESRGDTMSLAGYWQEVSAGLLNVDGIVTSWIQLRKPARHYLPREEYGWGRFGRVAELRRQVLERADPGVDFAEFDNDGPDGLPNSGDDDGYVDFVAFFYATDCDADGREGAIWPHRGSMAPYQTRDAAANGGAIRIADYLILPAQDPRTCGPAHIGVLAHETAHAFGLPDLYDYDGSSRGVGSWGLMGTGSHASPHSPAHLGPWAKEQLGWVQVDRVELADRAALPPVQTSARVLRYDFDDGTGRYLLLENRADHGSDRDLPGHGLLVWRVNPERAGLGAWNGDERRPAVGLLGTDDAGALVPVDGHDHSGPFPGRPAPAVAGSAPYPVRVTAISEDGGLGVVLTAAEPGTWSAGELRVATVIGGEPLRRRIELDGGRDGWVARGTATWLRLVRDGEGVMVEADPFGLAAGTYTDTLALLEEVGGRVTDRLPVTLEVAAPGAPVVVATELPWSWGLASGASGLVQAGYGWDIFGLRPHPRLLRLREGDRFPTTLSRLPVEALYSPVPTAGGGAYILGHARGQNLIYHVDRDGSATIVTDDVGSEPGYGLAGLPDGSLLMAGLSGKILRIAPDGEESRWADLGRAIYQIATDGQGVAYAALLSGQVARVEPGAGVTLLETGFGRGGLVTVTVAPDGRVFAAERGGEGRIIEVTRDGPRLLARAEGSAFFGLAADPLFLYALDLNRRELLRLPIAGPGGRMLAVSPAAAPAPPTRGGGS